MMKKKNILELGYLNIQRLHIAIPGEKEGYIFISSENHSFPKITEIHTTNDELTVVIRKGFEYHKMIYQEFMEFIVFDNYEEMMKFKAIEGL